MGSPTGGASALPNVSGHGMAQQSPSSAGPPSTPNLGGMNAGQNAGMAQGVFGNLTPQQMQQLGLTPQQIKSYQVQRMMQAQARARTAGGMRGMNRDRVSKMGQQQPARGDMQRVQQEGGD